MEVNLISKFLNFYFEFLFGRGNDHWKDFKFRYGFFKVVKILLLFLHVHPMSCLQ